MLFSKVDRISAVLREEDIEGLIAIHGAPDDEYESEAERIRERISKNPHANEEEICAIVRDVWAEMFELDETRPIEARINFSPSQRETDTVNQRRRRGIR